MRMCSIHRNSGLLVLLLSLSITSLRAADTATELKIGQKYECKWGGLYQEGSIVNKRGQWILFAYNSGGRREWVEPWRLRAIGSTDDSVGYAHPNPVVQKGDGPPTPEPGPAPEDPAHPHPAAGDVKRGDIKKGDTSLGSTGPGAAVFDASAATPLTAIDSTSMLTLTPAPPQAGVVFAPDGALAAKGLSTKPIVLAGGVGGVFDSTQTLLVSSPSTAIAAAAHVNAPPGEPMQVRVSRIDLAAGRLLNTLDLPTPVNCLSLSPDGKLLLTNSAGVGQGRALRLDVWQIDGKGATHVSSFTPFGDQEEYARDVAEAQFIDAGHVIALQEGYQKLTVFDVHAKAIWTTKVTASTGYAVSPGGKQVAFIANKCLNIVDALSGKMLQQISVPHWSGVELTFRPDGTQLAESATDQLNVWDLTTGKLAAEINPVGLRGGHVAWPAEGYALLDDRDLISLEKRLVVWRYVHSKGQTREPDIFFADRLWFVTRSGKSHTSAPVLASATVPDATASATIAKANLDDLLAVKPGTTVSLEVNLPADVAANATDAIKTQCAHNHFTIADGAAVKIVANTQAGKTTEMSYSSSTGFGARQKVSVTPTLYRLALVGSDGKTLWERTTSELPPMFVSVKKDQTIDQAVAEASKPRADFFSTTVLPRYVPKATDKPGLGETFLTLPGAAEK